MNDVTQAAERVANELCKAARLSTINVPIFAKVLRPHLEPLAAVRTYCMAHNHSGCNPGTHETCAEILRIIGPNSGDAAE